MRSSVLQVEGREPSGVRRTKKNGGCATPVDCRKNPLDRNQATAKLRRVVFASRSRSRSRRARRRARVLWWLEQIGGTV